MMRALLTSTLALTMLVGPACAQSAQGGVEVVLDDFGHPGWGVRWMTLEFSRGVSPRLSERGEIQVPPGGELTLVTQQETHTYDGIRAKPHWPIPGRVESITLEAMNPIGPAIDVTAIVRDSEGEDHRLGPHTLGAAPEVQPLTFDLPAAMADARLVGFAFARAEGQTGPEFVPTVRLGRIIAGIEPADAGLHLSAGQCDFSQAIVPGHEVRFFARPQSLAGASGRAAVRMVLDGEVVQQQSVALGQSAEFAWTPDAGGVHELEFQAEMGELTASAGQRQLAVFRPERLDGQQNVVSLRRRQATILDTQNPSPFAILRGNLSPAMVLSFRVGEQARIRLFDGIDSAGLAPPQYVAYPTAGGVRVARIDAGPDLSEMTEPWLILFAGDAEGWGEIELVSRGRRIPAPMDLPWLVVPMNRPSGLSIDAGGVELALTVPNGREGLVALMPLHGVRTMDPNVTAGWAGTGLPADEARHALTWARRLMRMPLGVREDFQVDTTDDVVTIRQQFDWVDVPNDWSAEGETFAPVPPMLAMAEANGYPVTFKTLDGEPLELTDGGVVTGVGPVTGIVGVDEYVYEIHGVLKYINEDRLPNPDAEGDFAAELIRHMREQAGVGERGTSPDRWRPGTGGREDYGNAMVGNSERQGLLGSTIPYVDDPVERQWRIDTLLVDALYLLNPHNYGYRHEQFNNRIYAQEGRGYYRFGRGWVDSNAYTGECLRALDYYAKYTHDVQLIEAHWPMLRSLFNVVSDFPRHGEWESSCFDTGGGDTWDSIYNATVAFARLADRVGDDASYRYACYYFAKHLATLPGHRQTNVVVAQQPYWASMLQVVGFNEAGEIVEYDPDLALNWRGGQAEIRDLVFSDLWGGNFGYRPWNQTVWMRGSRSEYRAAIDLTPDYATYWLDGRVRKFSPLWHQQVLVNHEPPTDDAIDLRTGAPAAPTAGDYVGKINLQARAICLGESMEQLQALYQLRGQGVAVGSDGRVPRICTPAALLEDGPGRPWVRLFGLEPGQTSADWELGRSAFMSAGDEPYVTWLNVEPGGARLSWSVFVGPRAEENLQFGSIRPAGMRLENLRTQGLNWNTTIYQADLVQEASAE